jgi:two-component system, NtrC family, response regulator AtoC
MERLSGDEVVLVVQRGDCVATFTLPRSGTVSIGRAADCNLRIDEPTVSRHHARLSIGDVITIEDLGSANGTHVAMRSMVLGVRVSVDAGESIQIGSVLATVQRRSRTAGPERRLMARGSAITQG